MTTQTPTIAALLSELSYLPANDRQFAMQRSETLAELEREYYSFRNAQERKGWRCEAGLYGFSVYDHNGRIVGSDALETHAWAAAQLSTYSLS